MRLSVLSHKQQRRLIRAIKESPYYDPEQGIPALTVELYKKFTESKAVIEKRRKKRKNKPVKK